MTALCVYVNVKSHFTTHHKSLEALLLKGFQTFWLELFLNRILYFAIKIPPQMVVKSKTGHNPLFQFARQVPLQSHLFCTHISMTFLTSIYTYSNLHRYPLTVRNLLVGFDVLSNVIAGEVQGVILRF